MDQLPDDYYRMLNVDNEDLQTLLKSVDLEIPCKLFTRGELKNLKSQINIF